MIYYTEMRKKVAKWEMGDSFFLLLSFLQPLNKMSCFLKNSYYYILDSLELPRIFVGMKIIGIKF